MSRSDPDRFNAEVLSRLDVVEPRRRFLDRDARRALVAVGFLLVGGIVILLASSELGSVHRLGPPTDEASPLRPSRILDAVDRTRVPAAGVPASRDDAPDGTSPATEGEGVRYDSVEAMAPGRRS